jgi:PHD/YefM family antitoxin component YafN of YafNO toxin-antitoxin module
MSSITTVAKFREKLSTWLDSATKGPVFINRGSERFALMNEDLYRDLQQKVEDLQTSLLAVMESKENTSSKSMDDMLSKLTKYKRKKA